MHIPEAHYRVSVKARIVDDQGRPLFSKVCNGAWDMLGGGIDHGETPQQALVREVREEAGLEINRVDDTVLHFIPFQTNKGIWRANVYYKATLKNHDFVPSPECLELKYMNTKEIMEYPVYEQLQKTSLYIMSLA